MHKVAILDAGAQYGKVIDRRVRELGINTEILPLNASSTLLRQFDALIISGGPQSVTSKKAPAYNPDMFSLGIPVLGICYGMQLMNVVFGGKVEKLPRREDCETIINIHHSKLFEGLATHEQVLMSHGDSISRIAEGFRIIAHSQELPAAIEHTKLQLYGTQFHPEVDLTTNGKRILSNFLFSIAHLEASFTLSNRLPDIIQELKQTIGNRSVLSLVSGGVDSTVATALVAQAIGSERITAYHIDHGFMRKDESIWVKNALAKVGVDVQVIQAQQDFAQATTTINGILHGPLCEVADPEVKRKIIGDAFMKVTDTILNDSDNTLLLQGTLRPDLIESASELVSSNASVIKTHHNDSELVRKKRQKGLVIEPNKDLHKDEVRKIGLLLGLPSELVHRQPFPGPGLAIRIICSQYEQEDVLKKVRVELASFSSEQFNIHLLPIRSVGVQGDDRSYGFVAAITGKADWVTLKSLANRIPQSVHAINRVVYVFNKTSLQEPFTLTPTYLQPHTISLLQEADMLVSQVMKSVAQCPVILTPVSFSQNNQRSLVLRPFLTNDFMTGSPALPGKDIDESLVFDLVRQLESLQGISAVMYDLTSKPPGTTEWE